eukprot:111462-Chlamydomonas_euryale.AAC.1
MPTGWGSAGAGSACLDFPAWLHGVHSHVKGLNGSHPESQVGEQVETGTESQTREAAKTAPRATSENKLRSLRAGQDSSESRVKDQTKNALRARSESQPRPL